MAEKKPESIPSAVSAAAASAVAQSKESVHHAASSVQNAASSAVCKTKEVCKTELWPQFANLFTKALLVGVPTTIAAFTFCRSFGAQAFLTGGGIGTGLGYAWCQNDLACRGDLLAASHMSRSPTETLRRWLDKGKSIVPQSLKFKE